jgi:hypothetical protein
MNRIAPVLVVLSASVCSALVSARLPPPSDEAKAKAAETAAKTAHADKVAAYQVCKSMNRVAAEYFAAARKAGRPTKAPVATPPCVDPGPFVYTPAGPAVAAAASAKK